MSGWSLERKVIFSRPKMLLRSFDQYKRDRSLGHRVSGKILALDVSKAVKSVSPPNEKSFPDSLRMSPCAERLP